MRQCRPCCTESDPVLKIRHRHPDRVAGCAPRYRFRLSRVPFSGSSPIAATQLAHGRNCSRAMPATTCQKTLNLPKRRPKTSSRLSEPISSKIPYLLENRRFLLWRHPGPASLAEKLDVLKTLTVSRLTNLRKLISPLRVSTRRALR